MVSLLMNAWQEQHQISDHQSQSIQDVSETRCSSTRRCSTHDQDEVWHQYSEHFDNMMIIMLIIVKYVIEVCRN